MHECTISNSFHLPVSSVLCSHTSSKPSQPAQTLFTRQRRTHHISVLDNLTATFPSNFGRNSLASTSLCTSTFKTSYIVDPCLESAYIASLASVPQSSPSPNQMALAMASAMSSAQDADLMDIDIDMDMDDEGPILDDEFQLEVRWPSLCLCPPKPHTLHYRKAKNPRLCLPALYPLSRTPQPLSQQSTPKTPRSNHNGTRFTSAVSTTCTPTTS